MPSPLLILFAVTITFALDTLIVFPVQGKSSVPFVESFDTVLKQTLQHHLTGYGMVVLDSAQLPTVTDNGALHRSLLRCRFSKHNQGMTFYFSVISGQEGGRYEREVSWDTLQTVQANLMLVTSKLRHLFEENLLARIQLQAEPPSATLIIDDKMRVATPFESYLPLGQHAFALFAEGFDTLRVLENVGPVNNRFSFSLKPQVQIPEPVSIIVREKEREFLPWWIASGTLLVLTAVSHGFYTKTVKDYDALVSDNKVSYDALDREADRWLLVRNVSSISFSITALCGVLFKIKHSKNQQNR